MEEVVKPCAYKDLWPFFLRLCNKDVEDQIVMLASESQRLAKRNRADRS